MIERLTPATIGEWTLVCSAGRVELTIKDASTVAWTLARDTIGSFAAVPSQSGDAVDWATLKLGAIPALWIEKRGQKGGETVYGAASLTLTEQWRIVRIRPLPPHSDGERFSEGRLVQCWHQHMHADSCRCPCGCCREQHLERLDAFDGRRVTIYTLSSAYILDGLGTVTRVPDGDDRRAQVMHGVAVSTPIVLGAGALMIFDGSMRRTSAVQAIVVEG